MPVIAHVTRQHTAGGWVQERPCLLQAETHQLSGSQTKGACVLCVTLNSMTSVCERVKRQSQEKPPPTGDKESQSAPKTIHVPSGQGPPASPQRLVGEPRHHRHPRMFESEFRKCVFSFGRQNSLTHESSLLREIGWVSPALLFCRRRI